MLHTLFQTSMKYSNINRFDEYFVVDLIVDEGEVQGLIAIHMSEGELITIKAKSVVLATGGAGRVYHCNTNGGIVTGDGMAMAYRMVCHCVIWNLSNTTQLACQVPAS
ncbi:succinate dehydrogenase flavoprotein subunit [Vibrio astriarenae]|nr:succinate dehydrogenase flavoprotein subunit [Vibrio sp. C7]